MRFLVVLLFLRLSPACANAADQPPVPAKQPAAVSPQDQAKAVADAMAASLAAQRKSITAQTGQTASESFFLLPRQSHGVEPGRSFAAPTEDCDPLPSSTVDPMVNEAASNEGLQPDVLRSLIRTESGFRPCAVSPKGAMGLMQLMPSTATGLGVKNPFDPKENIDGGAKFLRQMLDLFNDLPLALGAYNAGPVRVTEAGGIPNIPETRRYVDRVLSGVPIR